MLFISFKSFFEGEGRPISMCTIFETKSVLITVIFPKGVRSLLDHLLISFMISVSFFINIYISYIF